MMRSAAALFVLGLGVVTVQPVNAKSKKPPMGWSSWCTGFILCLACPLPPLPPEPEPLTPLALCLCADAFGGCGQVNQTKMEETFAKLTNRSVVAGSTKSLLDVGYTFANLDDGWQDCGKGVNGGYHDKDGCELSSATQLSPFGAFPDRISVQFLPASR